jgi:hypothetical protein
MRDHQSGPVRGSVREARADHGETPQGERAPLHPVNTRVLMTKDKALAAPEHGSHHSYH